MIRDGDGDVAVDARADGEVEDGERSEFGIRLERRRLAVDEIGQRSALGNLGRSGIDAE